MIIRTLQICLFLSLCSTVQARSLDDIVKSGFIEFAVYDNFPPYSHLDESGAASGIDVDVAKIIASELGVEPRWFWLTADESVSDDLRNAVWKGSKVGKHIADLMLRVPYDSRYSHAVDGYGLPKNDLVVFFSPYHEESWSIVKDAKKTKGIRTLAIYRYQKIGVELDSLPDFHLLGLYNGAVRNNVVHYTDTISAVKGFKNKEVAAVIGTRSQVEWGLGGGKKPSNYDVTKDGLESFAGKGWDIGMAVRHDFRQLSYRVEDIVSNAINKGKIKAVFDKYGITYSIPDYRK